MFNIIVPVVVSHPFNGHADPAPEFVEVDGKKFEKGENGQPKKDDQGNPIPFKESAPDKPKIDDLENADLEALAKVNPRVAKMLADQREADKREADRKKEEDERKRKEAEQKGEWQKLAEESRQKVSDLEKALQQKEELLGKYKGSVESVLKEVMATIPKENHSLIPAEFSPRQKLEYITKNAKQLGAKMTGGKGGGVPPSDPPPDELQKNIDEFNALVTKGATRTQAETKRMNELAVEIKKIQAAKAEKK